MKKCTRCHELKELVQFSKHPKNRDGLQSRCTQCQVKETNAYRYGPARERNKQRVISEAINRGGCADYAVQLPDDITCVKQWTEENYFMCDWDHLPQYVKTMQISKLVTRGYPLLRLDTELAKCEPVCSFHHRLRTVGRR